MKSHEFDRISMVFGTITVAAGGVTIVQQAGVWEPSTRTLIALAVAAIALALAAMWPRHWRRHDPLTTDTPGSAINRLPGAGPGTPPSHSQTSSVQHNLVRSPRDTDGGGSQR